MGGDFRIEIDTFKGHLPGFDLGEVQDIIDQTKEGFGAAFDGQGTVSLFLVQLRCQEDVGEADNSIHRRANFMAHGGEKFAFSAVCPFGSLYGFAKLQGLGHDFCLQGFRVVLLLLLNSAITPFRFFQQLLMLEIHYLKFSAELVFVDGYFLFKPFDFFVRKMFSQPKID